MDNSASTEQIKSVVRRFNKEVIEQGNAESFKSLMADTFVNHSAPPGMDAGPQGMWNTFTKVLHPAFPDLRVEIHDQIAEGNRVTTRKTIRGTHQGALMGIPPTGRKVAIDVIDIVVVRENQYVEHWGINSLGSVLAQLRQPA